MNVLTQTVLPHICVQPSISTAPAVERASPDSLNDPCLRQPSGAKQREKEKEKGKGITGTTQG